MPSLSKNASRIKFTYNSRTMKKVETVEEEIVIAHDDKYGAYKKGEILTIYIVCFAKDFNNYPYADLYTIVILNSDGYQLTVLRPAMLRCKAALAANGIAWDFKRNKQR